MRQPVPFGKYLLLDRISVGGMAEVFKAKSYGIEGFEKVIAIKRILPSMCEDQDFIKMFIDEAKIAGQLSHANICQIFELGRVKAAHFIAMEYISGRDLLQIQNRCRQRGARIPVEMACFVVSQVCEGLDYAHQKKDPLGRPLQIIHRDCSPQNVLVSYEGEVKVIDFGIAKAASRSSRTNAGVLKGKFGYMSPEQVRGLPLDRRSDIFALGTILYESLTGERLFLGESDFSTLERVRNADVKPPSELNADIPAEVERVVLKALARNPDDRYQWCGDLRADLQRFLTQREAAFTAKSLSEWMRGMFEAELEQERRLMEDYKKVGRDGLIAGVPHAEADLDVVSELGEAGDPEGDPTVLGGPSIEEMLAEAERRFSARESSQANDDSSDVAGELEADATEPPTLLAERSRTVALDDEELGSLVEEEERATPPPAWTAAASVPPTLVMPPPQQGPAATATASAAPVTGRTAPVTARTAPVTARTAPVTARTSPPPLQLGESGVPEYGMTTEAVPRLSPAGRRGGGRWLGALASWRHKRLARDIAMGVGIAGVVLGAFFVGRRLFAHTPKGARAGHATLAMLTSDGEPADIFLNGRAAGRFADGKTVTLTNLAAGPYTVEMRRDGFQPCIQTVNLAQSVEVVTCRFAPPVATTGSLILDGITGDHRVFIDETEISNQAAREPIELEPGSEHVVRIRVGDAEVQELRVEVEAGQTVEREIVAAPEPPAAADDHRAAPERSSPPERPARSRDRSASRREAQPRSHHRSRDHAPDDENGEEARPTVGYLTAATKPWARVMIDGRDTGKMTPIPPRTKIGLKPGRHKVTFLVDGQTFSYTITVVAGQTVHLQKTLLQ